MAYKKINKQYWDKLIYSEHEIEMRNFIVGEFKNGSLKFFINRLRLRRILNLVIKISVLLAFSLASLLSDRGVEPTIVGSVVVVIIGLVLIIDIFLTLYFTKKWIYELPENTRKEYIRILKIKYKRYLTLAAYAIFWSIIVSFILIVLANLFATYNK